MHYQQLVFIVDAELAENCAEWLEERGTLSVIFSESDNEPLFQIGVNDTPLWKKTKVTAFYEQAVDLAPLITAFTNQFKEIETLHVEIIENQDWVRLSQQNFPTQCYSNNLWIVPSWEKPEKHFHNIVRIDPGLAFGTGTHATTAMCLDYLANHPPKAQDVIDFGCGSGILSLAALALGANKVYALDHDEQAILATNNNAALNDFTNPHNLSVSDSRTLPKIKAPLIIANILATPLIQLAPQILELLQADGKLILSGLLKEEVHTVFAAYQKNCTLLNTVIKDEWALLECIKS